MTKYFSINTFANSKILTVFFTFLFFNNIQSQNIDSVSIDSIKLGIILDDERIIMEYINSNKTYLPDSVSILEAVKLDRIRISKTLISLFHEDSVNPNILNSALWASLSNMSEDLTSFLLKKGADINNIVSGETPLENSLAVGKMIEELGGTASKKFYVKLSYLSKNDFTAIFDAFRKRDDKAYGKIQVSYYKVAGTYEINAKRYSEQTNAIYYPALAKLVVDREYNLKNIKKLDDALRALAEFHINKFAEY